MRRRMRSTNRNVLLLAGIILLCLTKKGDLAFVVVAVSANTQTQTTAALNSRRQLHHHHHQIGIIATNVDMSDIGTISDRATSILYRIRGGAFDDDYDDDEAVVNSSSVVLDGDDDDDDSINDDDTERGIAVTTDTNDNDEVVPSAIFEGSFKDALVYAKQQGRLLILFIPQKPNPTPSSTKRSSNDAKSIDNAIMSSFTSSKVTKAAQQSPPKSKKSKALSSNNNNAGSFVLYCCSSGMTSTDATVILKRIQGGTIQYKNSAGHKRPILMALYPHTSPTSLTIVPRLLTQHHCSPPPTTTKFVDWLKTIRTRNKKYYTALQKQLQEFQWEKERKHGYQTSIRSDIEMKQREIDQEIQRQRSLRQEQERIQQLQQRRIQLLEALQKVTAPTATSSSDTTTTNTTVVALRFSSGQTDRRNFSNTATIRDIFHWIDAIHEIPYETISIQTMNGKRTFVYSVNDNTNGDPTHQSPSDKTNADNNIDVFIHEAGLGKMIGLRVLTNKANNDTPATIPK